MSTALLMIPEGCGRCGEPRDLFLCTIKGRLCFACWRALGEPAGAAPSGAPATASAAFEQEQRTRERMAKRGGSDQNIVRKGLS